MRAAIAQRENTELIRGILSIASPDVRLRPIALAPRLVPREARGGAIEAPQGGAVVELPSVTLLRDSSPLARLGMTVGAVLVAARLGR
jgi:hypothetical protein